MVYLMAGCEALQIWSVPGKSFLRTLLPSVIGWTISFETQSTFHNAGVYALFFICKEKGVVNSDQTSHLPSTISYNPTAPIPNALRLSSASDINLTGLAALSTARRVTAGQKPRTQSSPRLIGRREDQPLQPRTTCRQPPWYLPPPHVALTH